MREQHQTEDALPFRHFFFHKRVVDHQNDGDQVDAHLQIGKAVQSGVGRVAVQIEEGAYNGGDMHEVRRALFFFAIALGHAVKDHAGEQEIRHIRQHVQPVIGIIGEPGREKLHEHAIRKLCEKHPAHFVQIHVFHGFPVACGRIHRFIIPVELPAVPAHMCEIPDRQDQKDKCDQVVPVQVVFLERAAFLVKEPEQSAGNNIENPEHIEI